GPTLWGLPVIDTTAVEEGEFLVGNFQMAAMLWDREDAVVDISTEDRDNFVKNMVTIRAEERLALEVSRPEALIYGDFDDALSG
ncbi:phage major capsid protein, partial [Corallococcus exiguus]|nr:phage major capsid protein [Corallococcus exiguus]